MKQETIANLFDAVNDFAEKSKKATSGESRRHYAAGIRDLAAAILILDSRPASADEMLEVFRKISSA